MTAFNFLLIPLFITGIAATVYCDKKMKEEKEMAEKKQYPCGLPPPENCCILKESNFDQSPSGIYKMNTWCSGKLTIVDMYCDTTTANGGWTVIQRRKDGSENFHRSWLDYEKGFGDLNGEFWYGLKSLYCLTRTCQWELRIDFQLDNTTESRDYIHYTNFKVGSSSEEYPLTISGFTGDTITDPFSTGKHNGMKFSTYDNDNDNWGASCSVRIDNARKNGGWWFYYCWHINLNCQYSPIQYGSILIAGGWKNPRWIEMKIRPLNCIPQ
ncbi:fibrinogen-like protein A [Dysidea avara]|uniref:fibrinogen-like protein A n=1 Tax=Dysidea avara TaxID=196820 RepID=UPI003322268E